MNAVSAALARLRPHPHRGDVIAAGAVPLALAAVVIELRMTQWGVGARFAVVVLIAALLLTMGWLAPLEGDVPRPYHSLLLLAGLLPMIVALQLLAEVLGARRPPGAGADFWIFGLEAVLAAAAARRANSAVCTLVAALAGAVALESFVQWVFAPHGVGTFRAILVVLTLAFFAGAVRLRDRLRRHAVQLINAGAVVTVVLATSFLLQEAVRVALGGAGFAGVGWFGGVSGGVGVGAGGGSFGWKLWILAVGFGLIAYAAADREPGPAYFGVVLLVEFAFLVGLPSAGRGSLVGWPLFLLVIGAIGLIVGLRPRRPLPPPPARSTAAPTVPLNRED
jgi:hypothetical protein